MSPVTMREILDSLPKAAKAQLREEKQPQWARPMLPTLTHQRFSKEEWIYERKLDGERCLVLKNGGVVSLVSRNKKNKNHQYPEIINAFENLKNSVIIDGEVVAFDGNRTSLSKLQPRMHSNAPDKNVEIFFYAFDITYLDGYDLSGIELTHRKALLKKIVTFKHECLRFTPHRNTEGERFLKEACAKGWEGVIAKQADSRYIHGRSTKWLKFKCENRQELVICGYTAPEGSRTHFGALIVGFYEEGKLQHAGLFPAMDRYHSSRIKRKGPGFSGASEL